MTHDSAVRTIVSLVPEIEKRGAEVVLEEYARREDLPPAQLEKLAQVFNTLSTVSHIEKAADRGSSTTLIDVPTLVVSYATGIGAEKAAAPVARPTHSADSVDLLQLLNRELDTPAPSMAKAASTPEVAALTANQMREVAFDIECDAMLETEKAASEIRYLTDNGAYLDFSLAELDALCERTPEAVKAAFDWVSQYATRGTTVRRHDYEKSASASRGFHADTEIGRVAVRLVDAHCTWQLMHKVANSVIEDPPERALTPQELFAQAVASEEAEQVPPSSGAEGNDPYTTDEGVGAGGQAAPATPAAATTAEESTTPAQGNARPQKGGGKSDEKGPSTAEITGQAANIVLAPVSALSESIINAAGAADNALSAVTSKERTNTAQRRTDLSVADIRRAINIRRMIGTDPVLREADPREVLEIYNAIARANPEIAENSASMKLLLREAVSYEGLTLDSQKQLADIRKSTVETEGKAAENDRRRYSAGGSDLAQLVRLPSAKA